VADHLEAYHGAVADLLTSGGVHFAFEMAGVPAAMEAAYA